MEDPWGSPWATDDPSPIPTINLPAAPPPATLSSRSNSPRVSISAAGASPWQNDDDAWGGWNDAKSGTSSPGWGRSPGLKPAMVRERDVSPGPWMGRKSEETAADSAIGLEKEKKDSSFEAQDVWKGEEKEEEDAPTKPQANEESSASETESSARPESPDVPPPGPALRAEERPQPARSSSKVQELVDMYDGIARKSVSPVQSALVSPPPQKLRDVESEEDEEWGEVVTSPTVASPTTALGLEPTAEAPEKTAPEAAPTTNGWLEDTTSHEADQASPPTTKSKIDISFPVDLGKLDELFPSTPPTTVSPEPLPDTIIDDTFANISERKTWYRVSRFGSMRKHNQGNDENYIRMDWTHSAARDKSLRIVRRWMEEDSIAGRVTLGARQKGAIGGSMFNWDAKAEPVDMGELLGRKKGHERRGSKGSKGSKGDTVSPVGATFGWSSQTTSPTGASAPVLPNNKVDGLSGAKSRPQSLIMPSPSEAMNSNDPAAKLKTRPQSLIMPPTQVMNRPSIDRALAPSPTARLNSPLSIPKPADKEDYDDDDWGEMVSSPTVPTAGASTMAGAEASGFDRPIDQKITSPSEASFGWGEGSGLPQISPEQTKATIKKELDHNGTNFGWDSFEQQSQPTEPSLQQSKPPPNPQPASSSAMFGRDNFEKPASGAANEPQASAASFGWDDFEKPQATSKGASTATAQGSASMFGWDDFEKPSQGALKAPSPEEKKPSDSLFGWGQSMAPNNGTVLQGVKASTSPTAADTKGPGGDGSLIDNKQQTSSTTTSPQLSSPAVSFAKPTETSGPSPTLSQPSKPRTKTSTRTQKDDATVARILNDLPDLSYMLR